MSIIPDWRSATAADDLNQLNRPGFAQEFLRRNHDYQEDYHQMARRVATGAVNEDAATLALVHRWGLSFRVRSDSLCGPNSGVVAARTCS